MKCRVLCLSIRIDSEGKWRIIKPLVGDIIDAPDDETTKKRIDNGDITTNLEPPPKFDYSDLYISPEAMETIKNWDKDNEDCNIRLHHN